MKIKNIFRLYFIVCPVILSACFDNLAHHGKTPMKSLALTNEYPIVFVNGFFGWGRDEVLGYHYWGGRTDLQEELRQYGYETYTAAVGPFSSNWDRACELYACIKGGRVDYGEAHSKKFKHARYGRTYPGLYPQWSKTNKVHFITHSMGGQTARLLAQLLEHGCRDEIAATHPSHLFPLFEGEKSWIHSITTIASPHDGTSLLSSIDGFPDFIQSLVAYIASMTDSLEENFYDFKLDQWGLNQKDGESWTAYYHRVKKSAIWETTKDLSTWDNLPEGARELNTWVKAQPDIYYFSWATNQTVKRSSSGEHLPSIKMLPVFFPMAALMGSYTSNQTAHRTEKVTVDQSWWPNDGIVNTNSMDGPTLGTDDRIIPFSGTPQKGVWNFMGTLKSCDHADILGLLSYPGEEPLKGYSHLTEWYFHLADRLGSLPS